VSYFPQQFVVEVGGARKEFIQPGLEGLHWYGVLVIFHFFVCVGVGKYFFDKGGVVVGPIAGKTRHHSPREELNPIGLFLNVFLKGEHEVRGSFGVVLKVSLRSGVVRGLILLDLRLKFLQSLISFSVLVLVLLQLSPMKGFLALDGFDESLGHLYDGFRVIRGKGEEV
jgi:hypothetical protein